MLENLQVATLGATAGIVVGGSVFVMPAIFVLGLEGRSGFFQIFLVPFLGAVLGVLFLIPFRRYFVAEMHGKLPFPEATATTEILVTGEKGGTPAGRAARLDGARLRARLPRGRLRGVARHLHDRAGAGARRR